MTSFSRFGARKSKGAASSGRALTEARYGPAAGSSSGSLERSVHAGNRQSTRQGFRGTTYETAMKDGEDGSENAGSMEHRGRQGLGEILLCQNLQYMVAVSELSSMTNPARDDSSDDCSLFRYQSWPVCTIAYPVYVRTHVKSHFKHYSRAP